jgi:tellurite resistance protein TehA-like permease
MTADVLVRRAAATSTEWMNLLMMFVLICFLICLAEIWIVLSRFRSLGVSDHRLVRPQTWSVFCPVQAIGKECSNLQKNAAIRHQSQRGGSDSREAEVE